ncbi:hypothetical protein [Kitasatospora sp. NPDC088134]|uniref:hypothetical protein n=1 Tax=Kitasatospora sp. NPDC088134 TaxID=3364071 RepID=UPI00381666EF
MTVNRQPVGRDALCALGLVAAEVPLLCAAVWAAVLAAWGVTLDAPVAVVLCGAVAVGALAPVLVFLVGSARRGYRIAPAAMGLLGPVLAVLSLSRLGR